MGIFIFLIVGCLTGFVLFKKNTISISEECVEGMGRVSIIIPARNEEKNLPTILRSLQEQTYQPYEIIVVNDGSDDRTEEIANSYGVQVIENPKLPDGWTGKTWAVWNGYVASNGDILAFLDADVKLAPYALASLLQERQKKGGVISVVPYHNTKKFYERFALVTNILGMFAFTSPFERTSVNKGLYGSCILATRTDYEKINGHASIKSELLDDLNLGAKFIGAGIKVNNFIGGDMVSFRMYPHGLRSELEGFAKGAVLSTSSLSFPTLLCTVIWIVGLIGSGAFAFFIHTSLFIPLLIGYLLYMLQIFYLTKYVGYFGKIMPILHLLSTLFFIIVILYSTYRVVFRKTVAWKGRNVTVRR